MEISTCDKGMTSYLIEGADCDVILLHDEFDQPRYVSFIDPVEHETVIAEFRQIPEIIAALSVILTKFSGVIPNSSDISVWHESDRQSKEPN
jgi:hypothetical protein